MKKNPFQFGKPVRDPDDFFGREEEIRNMYHQIMALNSISLIGERKSSNCYKCHNTKVNLI